MAAAGSVGKRCSCWISIDLNLAKGHVFLEPNFCGSDQMYAFSGPFGKFGAKRIDLPLQVAKSIHIPISGPPGWGDSDGFEDPWVIFYSQFNFPEGLTFVFLKLRRFAHIG